MNKIINKIGKQNIYLVLFVIIILAITGLYKTFSLYTETENVSIIDGIKTYNFILNANNNTNSITIKAKDSKNIDITVQNKEALDLKYGIYYTYRGKIDNITMGYLSTNKHPAKDTIKSNESHVVKFFVYNDSDEDITIDFGIKYGVVNGGELYLNEYEYWFEKLIFLKDVEMGSYVDYSGNNGCVGDSCSGVNANSNLDNNGYCNDQNHEFLSSGWRIAYTDVSSAYIVSAGAPECMCTNNDGTTSILGCNAFLTNKEDLYLHHNNMNNIALKYCNSNYAYDGVCNGKTAWAMNVNDFKKITNSELNAEKCYNEKENDSCGYKNSLIDNGSYYWFSSNSNLDLYWDSQERFITENRINNINGVRPVLRLEKTIIVTGGLGTKEEPYTIRKLYSTPLSEAKAGSYVEYKGNNGCVDEYCSGKNANSSDINKGYCSDTNHEFLSDGWRIAYTEGNSAFLVSSGSPECMDSNLDENALNDLNLHANNLNKAALKYCNTEFSYGGVCNETTVWTMNVNDFGAITKNILNPEACINNMENNTCGYNNDLINIGSYYWYANKLDDTETNLYFNWNPSLKTLETNASNQKFGLRPMLKLDETVEIVSGFGTYDSPYIISNKK